ncbi:hypothetical protein QJS10_CPA10g01965 [Acorus calamus]|uniref:Serine aminopeptidase S33 domain-containing protein n=1 Tax=Acorus calamus TaxID=4465 RepID=A0AAV9DXX9_ACOCL|nr:hypothetical protein QJS10_CPA10g01965 [Acorus calamus]
MILVGPSLGAAVAIDFATNHPDAVEKLVLIDASIFQDGTDNMARSPRILAYIGVFILKSFPLRLYVNILALKRNSLSSIFDGARIGRLHCMLP